MKMPIELTAGAAPRVRRAAPATGRIDCNQRTFVADKAHLAHVDEGGAKTGRASPSVGIFWLIPSGGKAVLFTQQSALRDAEPYGECLTHPVGHYELWERLQALPFATLKKKGLPVEIKSTEYEHYPRGRVVYEKLSETFVIYADARLQVPEVTSKIMQAFQLEGQSSVVVRSDSHYRTR
jgi:hypothetical protein